MTDEQVADLVACLFGARTGIPVEMDPQTVAQARAGQQAILKVREE